MKKEDGRHARKAKTRTAILDALVALLDEGHPAPTAGEIAARADVAIRSIAQHFATREQLLLAVAERHVSRMPAPLTKSKATFAERLDLFVSQRAEVLETSSSMRMAAGLGREGSKAVDKAMQQTAQRRRKELQAVFSVELAKADGWVLTVADTLSNGTTWDGWRTTQSVTATASLMRESLRRLLAR